MKVSLVSANLVRQHFSEDQRAMVGARLANMGHGGDRRSDQAANLQVDSLTQASAADSVNVSERTVASARHVLDHGVPKLVAAVDQGLVPVSQAAGLVEYAERLLGRVRLSAAVFVAFARRRDG